MATPTDTGGSLEARQLPPLLTVEATTIPKNAMDACGFDTSSAPLARCSNKNGGDGKKSCRRLPLYSRAHHTAESPQKADHGRELSVYTNQWFHSMENGPAVVCCIHVCQVPQDRSLRLD